MVLESSILALCFLLSESVVVVVQSPRPLAPTPYSDNTCYPALLHLCPLCQQIIIVRLVVRLNMAMRWGSKNRGGGQYSHCYNQSNDCCTESTELIGEFGGVLLAA